MSKEFKAPRPIQEIQQEFAMLCAKAGELQYKILCFQSDLGKLNETLRDLNFEAVASQEATAKAKKAVEEQEAAKTEAPTQEATANG